MWLTGRAKVSGGICSWMLTGWLRTLGIKSSTSLGWDFDNRAANVIQKIILIWCGHAFYKCGFGVFSDWGFSLAVLYVRQNGLFPCHGGQKEYIGTSDCT